MEDECEMWNEEGKGAPVGKIHKNSCKEIYNI
jgi:hypothetical protein